MKDKGWEEFFCFLEQDKNSGYKISKYKYVESYYEFFDRDILEDRVKDTGGYFMLFLDAGLGHHCCLGLHVHVCSATTATIIVALIVGSVDWFAAGETI